MFNIEWKDLLVKNNVNLIDIRSFDKFFIGHVKNAVNVEEIELIKNPEKYLKKNDIYYIYCDYGNSGKSVVSYLNNIGYSTVNINGGYYNFLFRK